MVDLPLGILPCTLWKPTMACPSWRAAYTSFRQARISRSKIAAAIVECGSHSRRADALRCAACFAAKAYGSRAIAVILSGNGADGSKGLVPIKEGGGLVSRTGPRGSRVWQHAAQRHCHRKVDRVLQVADIPAVALLHAARIASPTPSNQPERTE